MIPVSILFSAVYFLTIPWHPFPGSWIVKAASVAILALMAGRRGTWGLATALAFSALGDALLEYSADLPFFIGGLLAFLLAHITYTVVFPRQWKAVRVTAGAILTLLYSAGLAAWLLPEVGTIVVPVAVYVAAITAMVMSIFTARLSNRWVETGAVLFLISDSVLAVDRFRMPVPFAEWIIWPTYYVGQLLIATGFLSALAQHTPPPTARAVQQ
jgi:uncharacterized membrane protein YhhN